MPKSPPGKARSRLNALKHGLRATDKIFLANLTPDDRHTFESLRRSLRRRFQPQTESEKLLADRISIHYFRLFRLYDFENIAANESRKNPLASASIIYHLDRFSRYDSRLERQLRSLQTELQHQTNLRQLLARKSLPGSH